MKNVTVLLILVAQVYGITRLSNTPWKIDKAPLALQFSTQGPIRQKISALQQLFVPLESTRYLHTVRSPTVPPPQAFKQIQDAVQIHSRGQAFPSNPPRNLPSYEIIPPKQYSSNNRYNFPQTESASKSKNLFYNVAPKTEYGLPKSPPEVYGPPTKSSENYKPPTKISENYGPPTKSVPNFRPLTKISETYGPPKINYGAPTPVVKYDAPKESYGVPPQVTYQTPRKSTINHNSQESSNQWTPIPTEEYVQPTGGYDHHIEQVRTDEDEVKFIIYKPRDEEVIKSTLIDHARNHGENIKFIYGPNLEVKHHQRVHLPPPKKNVVYILLKEPEIHTTVQVMDQPEEEQTKPEVFIIYETNDGVIRKHYDLTDDETKRLVNVLGDKMRLIKRDMTGDETGNTSKEESIFDEIDVQPEATSSSASFAKLTMSASIKREAIPSVSNEDTSTETEPSSSSSNEMSSN